MSYAVEKPRAVMDIENLIDYFLICFVDIGTGRRAHFEMYESHPLDRKNIIRILRKFTIITFNGNHYDVPMLRMSLRSGATNAMLKKMNDRIIVGGLKPWEAEREFDLPNIPFLDHIDIIEPAPGVQIGLKHYGGRLHSKRLQDLPFDPSTRAFDFGPEFRENTIAYCFNDCDTTIDLHNHIAPQLALRAQMSDQYGIDLRSKSDAQIAEAVIRHELERIKGDRIFRPELPHDYSFQYQVPSFIRFKTAQLREVLHVVKNATFRLKQTRVKENDEDAVSVGGVKVKISGIEMPAEIKGLRIKIGGSTYRMGIGGLHSSESKVVHESDDEIVINDDDVAAFYPAILLVCGLYPEHLGPEFLDVYRTLRERRIAAKKSKDKVTDMTLKITLNGCFGKLGSKWSFLYSPNLMLQVTITGQLSLLMLIEELEQAGIPVVSANTDGIVTRVPRDRLAEKIAIIKRWEIQTGFEMETAVYSYLYSRDVNNYLAVKAGTEEEPEVYRTLYGDDFAIKGGVKQKGAYAFVGSKGSPAEKNPTNYICIDAVVAYLTKGTPIMETLEWCPDIRRFLTVRRVTGGAMFKGEYLGKVVRWYYAKDSHDCIRRWTNGDKVAMSDGCQPLMELGGLPDNINYKRYYDEAVGMLGDLGVL